MAEPLTLTGQALEVRILRGSWGRLELAAGSDDERTPVTGQVLGIAPGATVQVQGFWKSTEKWGREFRAVAIETLIPADDAGAIAWLAGPAFPGLGRKRAAELVERFGTPGVWEVLERESHRLAELRGITPAMAEELGRAYSFSKHRREEMVQLRGWGLTDGQIGRLRAHFGDGVVEAVRRDPYELIEAVRGFGWERSDALARNMGLPHDHPSRIRACLRHGLTEAEGRGHCYWPAAKLLGITARVLELPVAPVRGVANALLDEGRIALAPPGRAYLPETLEAEERVVATVTALLEAAVARRVETAAARLLVADAAGSGSAAEPEAPGPEAQGTLPEVPTEASEGIALDESQRAAVEMVLGAPVSIITGSPGTGKTTVLRTVLDRLDETDVSYELASPTGKAAIRMTEATDGRDARTVHRLLEYGPWGGDGGWGFARNAKRPLETDLVVVDEASMLDVHLAAALCRAIDPGRTRLLLVGDADQLPSVGPGRVFADLIASQVVPTARLTTVHRAAAESWVCRSAPQILAGKVPELRECGDFWWLAREDAAGACEAVVEVVTQGLPNLGHDGAQVLVPQNVRGAGANALNRRLQALLNPAGDGAMPWRMGKGEGAWEMRVGDRVIQTMNNYELGVMNGEIGQVLELDDEVARVTFGGEQPVRYGRLVGDQLRLAYALTIHKSQGSEWPWVVVLCHSTHTHMLTRQLLYTAVTRAKVGVVLVGDEQGLNHAVKTVKDARRNTGLADAVRERRAGLVRLLRGLA